MGEQEEAEQEVKRGIRTRKQRLTRNRKILRQKEANEKDKEQNI